MRTKFIAALVVVIVVTIIVSLSNTRTATNNEGNDVIPLLSGWKKNIKTDHKMTIYGLYLLSTELDSDIAHDYYCTNDDCEFVVGNDNYAIINDGGYLIFSLVDSSYLIIDPIYDVETIQTIVKDGIIYGLVYRDEDDDIYYDINTKEYYLKGENVIIDYDTRYVADKNLVIYEKGTEYYVYDYKTNEVLIEAAYLQLTYLDNEGDYYITTYDNNGNILALYNSDFSKVDAINAKDAIMFNKLFMMTYDDKTFVVKNAVGEVITTSNTYNVINELINGYAIVENENKLLIVDINDDTIKEITFENRKYLSGRMENNNILHIYMDQDGNQIEATFNTKTFEYSENTI